MTPRHFIAGDWGTSNLRLYLCADPGGGSVSVLETRVGPGVGQVKSSIEETFFGLADDWFATHGALPVLLSGMVGSTIGWHPAPYVTCPAGAAQIADGVVVFTARGREICIIPGLKVENPLGWPDVLRGEELQLLGWMQEEGAQERGHRLFALPGTHNKWVLVKDQRIETFLTAPTGEVFALLREHSVLIAERADGLSEKAFMQGVHAIRGAGGAYLIHALFSTRSRQVLGDLAAGDASSYLSGLLIGADAGGAVSLFRRRDAALAAVTIIGDAALGECYRLALEQLGVRAQIADATRVTIAGYAAIYRHRHPKESTP